MPKNYLLIYSEQLATDIELLCQNIKAPSNTLFQIRKSSSSVYANIREANYGQSRFDMVSKFEIALKECSETEGWLKILFNTNAIDENTYKNHRNLRLLLLLYASLPKCRTPYGSGMVGTLMEVPNAGLPLQMQAPHQFALPRLKYIVSM